MSEKRRKLLLLYESCLLSRKNIRKILSVDPELKEINYYSKQHFIRFFGISDISAQKLYQRIQSQPLDNPQNISGIYIRRLTIFDPDYPSSLRVIPDPPLVLYVIGNPRLLEQIPSLSVVGTRKPSSEAKNKMEKILFPLIKEGWTIVSGMAKGIDSYAHYMTIQNNGHTIAVLGGGFFHIYPRENIRLFHRMAEEQLVISEYPPQVTPQRFYFPERNRIISGLGFGTLVVEAEEKSGSLITADQALEQGKEVFAIPGSPLSPQAQGVNKLIQQGAKLVNCPADIKEEWKVFS